jgi:hypothetical protein
MIKKYKQIINNISIQNPSHFQRNEHCHFKMCVVWEITILHVYIKIGVYLFIYLYEMWLCYNFPKPSSLVLLLLSMENLWWGSVHIFYSIIYRPMMQKLWNLITCIFWKLIYVFKMTFSHSSSIRILKLNPFWS